MFKNKNIYSKESHKVSVFTDGSFDPHSKKGSWASILKVNGQKKILTGIHDEVSQHEMELVAVLESLRYLEENYVSSHLIQIYTDSEYVTNLLKRRQKLEQNQFLTKKGHYVANHELVKRFYSYLDKTSIQIFRVPSHQKKGVSEISDFNREVDKLSRKILRKEIRNQ